jgi:hypothetical protein
MTATAHDDHVKIEWANLVAHRQLLLKGEVHATGSVSGSRATEATPT